MRGLVSPLTGICSSGLNRFWPSMYNLNSIEIVVQVLVFGPVKNTVMFSGDLMDVTEKDIGHWFWTESVFNGLFGLDKFLLIAFGVLFMYFVKWRGKWFTLASLCQVKLLVWDCSYLIFEFEVFSYIPCDWVPSLTLLQHCVLIINMASFDKTLNSGFFIKCLFSLTETNVMSANVWSGSVSTIEALMHALNVAVYFHVWNF